ncbi:hypothetical protein [Tunturiibacter gelidoferens]|uniref:Uncharacterized protein n=1 Tax=Tunturiibacter lichenicola TaxID=2051959 RepID=A0A7Y9NKL9_9BACT|nr:hypothetical protein [Edaphobacter lichenicola]NYF51084.1 hypothetical protein [Edaphobacter lichenicola]
MSDTEPEMRRKPTATGGVLLDNFVLVVGSNRGLEDFESSDDCEDLMREFFRQLSFEYHVPFVCASVQEPASTSTGGTRKKRKSKTADAYGQPYMLKPKILERAVMACAGDFKNVMSMAFLDYVRDQTPFTEYGRYFRPLSGLSPAEKHSAILDAHKFLIESKSRFGTYVEVRLQGRRQHGLIWQSMKSGHGSMTRSSGNNGKSRWPTLSSRNPF